MSKQGGWEHGCRDVLCAPLGLIIGLSEGHTETGLYVHLAGGGS